MHKIFFIILFLIMAACSPAKDKLYKETRSAMYTIVSITVSSNSEDKAKRAIDDAFAELGRLEKLLNYYSKDSEITLINRNAGIMPVVVSNETFELLEEAVYVSENTEGAFDITAGVIIDLWDIDKQIIPDEKSLSERVRLVGYKNIVLNKNSRTVFLRKKGMQINPGGIIKGYAADKAAEVIKKRGINSGIVAVGGDIKTFGIRPDSKPWKVGIQNPRQEDIGGKDEITASVDLTDSAISTSGDYKRFFVKDGKVYHHILNPKTGYPADKCRSVTVIAKKGVHSDAFSTGIFVLGPQKGIEVLKENGLEGIIMDNDRNIFFTEGLDKKLGLKK
ncbi:MAG: FAD:protein FMN transferase [Thermodesulfovibrionales bacterium]|nr:FAD:protein FMN transferase [Thermodesulfovibrionales bacterium]